MPDRRDACYRVGRSLSLLQQIVFALAWFPVVQVLLIGLAIAQLTSAADPRSKPNIIVILADDLGAHDLGCYGADLHETPAIDKLAAQGIRFTSAYAPSPVCTPTRASILTGKHPARLGMTIWSEGSLDGPKNRRLLQAESKHNLPLAEVTLAERLQQAGWLTASVGKWHLGDADHSPETQGFDINIGGTHWGAPQSYFWPYRGTGRFGKEFRYVPHLELGVEGEYLTDRLTSESIRVIDYAAETQKPFFLLLAHHAPHTPIEAKHSDVQEFAGKVRPEFLHRNPTYAAMIRSLDQSVEKIVERLQQHQIMDNTVIVFTSDNGGYIGQDALQRTITDNFPLRSGKGSLYEGGLRVPLIVHLPTVLTAVEVRDDLVVLTDLFPTLLGCVGLQSDKDTALDGEDLLPLLRNSQTSLSRKSLYFHYPHYYHAPPSTPASAIRTGRWKLLEHFEDGRTELYDLQDDPSEVRDLASLQPERVTQMRNELQRWRVSVDARLPSLNPEFRD